MKNNILVLVAAMVLAFTTKGQEMNGFRLDNSLIPVRKIHKGGPPKDGIPSIDNPKFVTPSKAWFLEKSDRVIGVVVDGVVKAYPIKILDRHEIVNDNFEDIYVVVTYCPLCGSGAVFNANIEGNKTFGVSGLLYNSDVLLYDRQTNSLWSQLEQKSISGPMKGKALELLPASNTTFGDWKKRYPETLVLSTDTGKNYDYVNYKAYDGYAESEQIWFPVEHKSKALPSKTLVAGIEINGNFKAYPFSKLNKNNPIFEDDFNSVIIKVVFDPKSESVVFFDSSGKVIPSISLYWFAWYAFHPDTAVFGSTEN